MLVAEYYTQIQMGTPPQSMNVDIDTGNFFIKNIFLIKIPGSSDLVIYGNSCEGCSLQQEKYFNPSLSSTLTYIKCLDRNYYCYGRYHLFKI